MSDETAADKAREWATKWHGCQMYGEGIPYTQHLEEVAAAVSPCGPELQAVAWLHDVLEDTEATFEDLKRHFGTSVAHMVWICTDIPGKNRGERKDRTNAKLATVGGPWIPALVVKTADRLCNLRAAVTRPRLLKMGFLKMYRREHPAFVEAVQRPGWADVFWEEMAEILSEPD